jgi:hypothetical protein
VQRVEKELVWVLLKFVSFLGDFLNILGDCFFVSFFG